VQVVVGVFLLPFAALLLIILVCSFVCFLLKGSENPIRKSPVHRVAQGKLFFQKPIRTYKCPYKDLS
jgi:hypothetical protein